MARPCTDPASRPAVRRRLVPSAAVVALAVLLGSSGSPRPRRPRRWSPGRRRRVARRTPATSPRPRRRRTRRPGASAPHPAGPEGRSGSPRPSSPAPRSWRSVRATWSPPTSDSGEPLWSVDRTYGPPVSPAVASTPDGRVLLYTQGFGDSPPGTSPTPSGAASASPAPSPTEPFASNLTAIDLATQEPIWDRPLQLKEVSRTGVTVEATPPTSATTGATSTRSTWRPARSGGPRRPEGSWPTRSPRPMGRSSSPSREAGPPGLDYGARRW